MKRISCRDLLEGGPPDDDAAVEGAELTRLYWTVKQREKDLARRERYWASVHDALGNAYQELEQRAHELQALREELVEVNAGLEKRVAEQVAEIMQFSQNFYVEVHEASTGIGAMELLIDPYTGAVHPEPGPNMMWNTKYGHMNGMGMMGGRYLGSSGAMRISGDQAVNLAQKWLDAHMSGVMAGDEAEAFYGYYTIHTMTDGAISGMLSVNGYTGQVWYHSWHGDFIDMTGGDEAV